MDLSKTIATIPVDVTTIWVLVLLTIVLLRLVIGRELISQLIQLLNSLNPQGWAFLILIIGVTSAVLFNRVGIAAEVAAGIIGAGINMFTGQQRSTPPPGTSTSHLEVDTSPPMKTTNPATDTSASKE